MYLIYYLQFLKALKIQRFKLVSLIFFIAYISIIRQIIMQKQQKPVSINIEELKSLIMKVKPDFTKVEVQPTDDYESYLYDGCSLQDYDDDIKGFSQYYLQWSNRYKNQYQQQNSQHQHQTKQYLGKSKKSVNSIYNMPLETSTLSKSSMRLSGYSEKDFYPLNNNYSAQTIDQISRNYCIPQNQVNQEQQQEYDSYQYQIQQNFDSIGKQKNNQSFRHIGHKSNQEQQKSNQEDQQDQYQDFINLKNNQKYRNYHKQIANKTSQNEEHQNQQDADTSQAHNFSSYNKGYKKWKKTKTTTQQRNQRRKIKRTQLKYRNNTNKKFRQNIQIKQNLKQSTQKQILGQIRLWSDQNFTKAQKQQLVAKVFCEIGPGFTIAQRALQMDIQKSRQSKVKAYTQRSVYANLLTQVVRQSFRQIQSLVIDQLKTQKLNNDQFQHLRTALCNCREWLSQRQVEVFMNFTKICYKLLTDSKPQFEDLVNLYKQFMVAHNNKKGAKKNPNKYVS